MRAAKKGKGSILGGIQQLQAYRLYIHPSCTGVIEEFQNYTWKKDKQTGEYINEPIDDFNHYIDSMRYSLQCVKGKLRTLDKNALQETKMYYLDKDTELTKDKVVKYIAKFRGNELPKLKMYRDYYDGTQPILEKYVSDATKPNNKLVVNYCYDIVENYSGYISGIPIAYSSDEDITDILEILRYNDYHTEDNE